MLKFTFSWKCWIQFISKVLNLDQVSIQAFVHCIFIFYLPRFPTFVFCFSKQINTIDSLHLYSPAHNNVTSTWTISTSKSPMEHDQDSWHNKIPVMFVFLPFSFSPSHSIVQKCFGNCFAGATDLCNDRSFISPPFWYIKQNGSLKFSRLFRLLLYLVRWWLTTFLFVYNNFDFSLFSLNTIDYY